MTTVTITINLSDLVDVVNNSNNPEVCKHILSGGQLKDLSKMYHDDFYQHRIIWEKKDGKKTDNFVILSATRYDVWLDRVYVKALAENSKIYWQGYYTWNAWCAMEEAQGDEYALMHMEEPEPTTDADLYNPNFH